MLTQPRTLFFDIGPRLAVYEWGAPNATSTVLCVHGLTRNGRDFDVLAQALSAHHRVLCVDMAGRGKSEWLTDTTQYNYPNYTGIMGRLVGALGLSACHWVGTSMGGIIGMMMANAFPGLLQSLTLNDIGCLVPAAGLARIASYVGTATHFATRELAETELRRRCAPYGITQETHWQNLFSHSIEEMPDGQFRLAYDPAIAANLPPPEQVQDVNLWGLWEAVKPIPTLLIRGMQSDLLTHDTALQMQTVHPRFSLLEIEGVGHAPALMDAAQVAAIDAHIASASSFGSAD